MLSNRERLFDVKYKLSLDRAVIGPVVGGWVSESRLGGRLMFNVSALNALACITSRLGL